MLVEKLQPFAIALVLGLLIGIERERSHPPGVQALGLRTFVLIALLGALAAWIPQPLVAWGITLFVAAAVVASYVRTARRSKEKITLGLTTEIAAVIVYVLGYLANQDPFMTLLLGLVVLIILFAKQRLHKFSRDQLRKEEMQATIIILVLALGVLPFLPNQAVDPWLLFNPRQFGILLLAITVMQFGAYAVTRVFGPQRGLLLSGFLSGMISSMIATASFSQQVKSNKLTPLAGSAAIVYSTLAMLVKFLVVLAIASSTLFWEILWPILLNCLVGLGVASWISQRVDVSLHKELPQPRNPLVLSTALRLAILIAGMLVIVAVAGRWLGVTGTNAVAFLGGLIDIHSVTFALGTLERTKQLIFPSAVFGIFLAVSASYLSKIAIVWISGKPRFAALTSGLLLLIFLPFGIWFFIVTI